MRLGIDAFAEVQQEARRGFQLVVELRPILGVDVGNLRVGPRKIGRAADLGGAQRALVIFVDRAAPVRQRDPLARRRSRDQTFGLDIANQCRQQRAVVGESNGAHRAGHRRLVGFGVLPLVAIVEVLRHAPERQDIVAEVIMQLDQTGIDGAAGRDRLDGVEARRSRLSLGDDRRDAIVLDEDRPALDDVALGGHRHDPSGQCPSLRVWGRAHGITPSGTVIAIVRRLAAASAPWRVAHGVSPRIQAGRPAGKSFAMMSTSSEGLKASP